jgi:hypothetical protein
VGIAILILLLLAALTGVLGAVLKFTLVLVLSLVLAVVVLAWYAKRRWRAFQHDVDTRVDEARRRREAYDVEPAPGEIGDGR